MLTNLEGQFIEIILEKVDIQKKIGSNIRKFINKQLKKIIPKNLT